MRIKSNPVYEFQVGDVVVDREVDHLRIRVRDDQWYSTGSSLNWTDNEVERGLNTRGLVWVGTRKHLIEVAPKPEAIK